MRVISGLFRGYCLNADSGNQTRPTADKVKESMFNMLCPYLYGGHALDCYAGTGALCIEAVSRGSLDAVCVDRQYAAIKTIHTNVSQSKQAERLLVCKMSESKAISHLSANHQQL